MWNTVVVNRLNIFLRTDIIQSCFCFLVSYQNYYPRVGKCMILGHVFFFNEFIIDPCKPIHPGRLSHEKVRSVRLK